MAGHLRGEPSALPLGLDDEHVVQSQRLELSRAQEEFLAKLYNNRVRQLSSKLVVLVVDLTSQHHKRGAVCGPDAICEAQGIHDQDL